MLPNTHPIKQIQVQVFWRFVSPLQKIPLAHYPISKIENNQASAVPLLEKRIDIIVKPGHQEVLKPLRTPEE